MVRCGVLVSDYSEVFTCEMVSQYASSGVFRLLGTTSLGAPIVLRSLVRTAFR